MIAGADSLFPAGRDRERVGRCETAYTDAGLSDSLFSQAKWLTRACGSVSGWDGVGNGRGGGASGCSRKPNLPDPLNCQLRSELLHLIEMRGPADQRLSGTRSVSVFLVNQRKPAPAGEEKPDAAYVFQPEIEVTRDRPLSLLPG